ncbi:MAG: LacI family DNA-binding transcriptional regulator [bacterium]
MTASIKDIAKHCSVSTSTVSLALRHDSRVSVELTTRINDVAIQLGYKRSDAARRLVMKRYSEQVTSRLVVLGLPKAFYKTHFFSEMFLGLLEVLEDHGYGVVTMTRLASDLKNWETSGSRIILSQHDIDGIVLFSPATDPKMANRLQDDPEFGKHPVIGLAGCGIEGFPSVFADYQQGAYKAASHLLELGHRHILYFYYEKTEIQSQKRLAGMCQAFAEYGIDAETCLYGLQFIHEWLIPYPFDNINVEQDLTQSPEERSAQENFLQYLREHPDITAICALNDAGALHIWHTLQNAGYKIPEDYSIIGFDDTDPYLDTNGKNLLTSVRLPLVEIGKHAAQLVIDFAHENSNNNQHFALPTELIIRHSTGPVR